MRIVIYIIFLTIVMTPEVFPQGVRKLNIIQANTLEGTDKGGQKIKKLIGDVILEHDGTYMYCDSAYNYESEDYFNAYGNVVIKQGDKFRLQGNFLNYNLRSKMAKVEQNVRLTDNEMTLTTDIIFYDMNNKIAWYPQGGVITDAENRKSSTRGYYHLNGRDMYFKNNVTRLYRIQSTNHIEKCCLARSRMSQQHDQSLFRKINGHAFEDFDL